MTAGAETVGVACLEAADGEMVVELAGEIDLGTADEVWAHLARVARPGRDVVVDLAHVTFMGSAGLTLLLRARSLVGDAGSFVVRNPSPFVLRFLELTGLDELLLIDVGIADIS